MRGHKTKEFSSKDSEDSDTESCFNTEYEESAPDTDPTNSDADADRDNDADISWLLEEDQDHPPEYYLNQENGFDEEDYMKEDYSDNSTVLLDAIRDRWHW